ncbi:uncharacterized protein LOC110690685 isoform X2 [Chenopodium quinoa]|uniref:uncharacterized protein LOC110690685 isoform X2 n=1 Tax=Chenopodium quinoa TaxID=63459 RepID=UPI000B791986|nr:uncharacterized protein LOC110690685 isoform X2 [Chenopodium quinoa]
MYSSTRSDPDFQSPKAQTPAPMNYSLVNAQSVLQLQQTQEGMLKIRSNFNGYQALNFIHGFRHLLLYSTSTSSSSSISTEVNSDFAIYLVDFLGFSKQQALSTSTKLAKFRLRQGVRLWKYIIIWKKIFEKAAKDCMI